MAVKLALRISTRIHAGIRRYQNVPSYKREEKKVPFELIINSSIRRRK